MHATRPTLYGTRHAVSAGHYLAAAAGFSVLEAGGNAVDAGCAAGIALGVLLGSLGAQSLIGAGNDGFVWGLPFEVLAVIVVAALALVLVAALLPARRATTVTPVEALRVV